MQFSDDDRTHLFFASARPTGVATMLPALLEQSVVAM